MRTGEAEVGLTKIPRLPWQGGFEGEMASISPSERSSSRTILFLSQETEARAVEVIPVVSQAVISTAGLLSTSPHSYSSALSMILTLVPVAWFSLGLNTPSYQLEVLGPTGDAGVFSHELYHLWWVREPPGWWICLRCSESQQYWMASDQQVGKNQRPRGRLVAEMRGRAVWEGAGHHPPSTPPLSLGVRAASEKVRERKEQLHFLRQIADASQHVRARTTC